MSDTDTDRPTGEQVDAALHRAELRYATEDERTFAAEVRALRAELDNERARHAGLQEAFTNARQEIRDEEERGALLVAALDEARAALAARTPRPADKVEQRFAYLANLDPGWDSYGADKIDPAAIDTARSVLTSLATPVHICGTVEGGIMLAWDDEQVTVTIEPGSRLSASVGEMCAEPEAARTPQPATFDGWADLPTPEDVAAEMSRQAVGSDTGARRASLIGTACQALDAIGTLRERGVHRSEPAAASLPADPEGSVTLDELSQPDPSLALVTDRDAALARMVDAAARWPEGSDAYVVPVPLGWLRALSVPAVPDGEDAAVDEMEGHFIDANERMGEALVAIGMALGLPRPCVGATWGAPEILARIAQWNGSLGSCYDHSILGHDDARVAAPVVGCSDCLDALTTPLPAGEDVPARLDAAAEVFNALGAEWGTVADYLSMTADELRDNCTPDVRAAVAAALARPTGGQE